MKKVGYDKKNTQGDWDYYIPTINNVSVSSSKEDACPNLALGTGPVVLTHDHCEIKYFF